MVSVYNSPLIQKIVPADVKHLKMVSVYNILVRDTFFKAPIAQWKEQQISNLSVEGSSPSWGTNFSSYVQTHAFRGPVYHDIYRALRISLSIFNVQNLAIYEKRCNFAAWN